MKIFEIQEFTKPNNNMEESLRVHARALVNLVNLGSLPEVNTLPLLIDNIKATQDINLKKYPNKYKKKAEIYTWCTGGRKAHDIVAIGKAKSGGACFTIKYIGK